MAILAAARRLAALARTRRNLHRRCLTFFRHISRSCDKCLEGELFCSSAALRRAGISGHARFDMTLRVGARLVLIGMATSIGSMARAAEQSAEPPQDPATAAPAPAAAPAAPRKPIKAAASGEQGSASEKPSGDASGTKEPEPPPLTGSGAPPAAGAAAPPAAGAAAPPTAPAAEGAAPVAPASDSGAGAAAAPAAVSPGEAAAVPSDAAGSPAAQEPAAVETEGFQVGLVSDRTKSKEAGADEPSEDDDIIENALPPGQLPMPGGLSLSVGSQLSAGQSTFQTGSSYARDEMVSWSLSLSPSYMFKDGTRISASASISQEVTQPNGDDDVPNNVLFSDVGLGASRPIYDFEDGPSFHGSINIGLPTSTASRVETLRATAGLRLTASQELGEDFSLSLGTGFRKNFHQYTVPTRDPRTGERLVTEDGLVVEEVVTGLARINGSELAGATYFDGESNNTSMVFSNSLSANYNASEKLNFGISYNLSHSWTYESFPLDELSGVGARAGRGRRDSHGGSLSASYQAMKQLSFGLGMATGGPTRTADDKHIRFPFFNFLGPESNMTTFFISATYTESIRL